MDKYWPEQDVFLAGQSSLSLKEPNGQSPCKDELVAYLTKFQESKLTSGTRDMPESFAVQREKLLDVMRKKLPEYGYHQAISGSGFDTSIPKFWELIFTLHYVTHEIELTGNMSNDAAQIAPGVSTARTIPFAEFEIVGKHLRQAIAQPPQTVIQATSEPAAHRVSIIMEANTVCALLPNGNKHPIKTLRVDHGPYNFMQYALAHPNTDLPLAIVQTQIEGCMATKNLTELIRACGFDKALKRMFFPGATAKKARFKQAVDLTSTQINSLTK
jgi:hypothetical protein